jgi:hypothetical protein
MRVHNVIPPRHLSWFGSVATQLRSSLVVLPARDRIDLETGDANVIELVVAVSRKFASGLVIALIGADSAPHKRHAAISATLLPFVLSIASRICCRNHAQPRSLSV